ncbi:MAG: ribosomal L7Ae/L30e/S12e/Gadd45 family protein [Clostridia bacterium]|nr:ribosomal L7Ae/L30e/S12e/Gadd45 family protein [Clostridia bacterium]
MKDSVLSFLGLAAKAGRLIYGSEAGSNAARSRRAKLVIVACDAADNTKKLMQNKCASNNIPLCEYADIESLSKAVGKGAVSVVSVSDEGFAKAIFKKIDVSHK